MTVKAMIWKDRRWHHSYPWQADIVAVDDGEILRHYEATSWAAVFAAAKNKINEINESVRIQNGN